MYLLRNQRWVARSRPLFSPQGSLTLGKRQVPFSRAKSDAWGAVPALKGANAENTAQNFGFLARDEILAPDKGAVGDYTRTVRLREQTVAYEEQISPFRNEDGSFIQGDTAEEARLDPRTLEARVDSSAIHLPPEIAKVINKNVLLQISPDKLRERAAVIFQLLEKEQIQKAPESGLDADAHIAALFLQNYAHSVRVLRELRKRAPGFLPDSVLDIGYGPATGMIALNELMGPDFAPKTKEAYIVGRGNKEMKKRAKILLSRQVSEVLELKNGDVSGKANETANKGTSNDDLEEAPETTGLDTSEEGLNSLELESQDFQGHIDREGDLVGPVDSSKLKIRTRLRDSLPSAKQYDLIMVNQSLLAREFNFPRDVDLNIEMILRLLKPDGYLVILERGNALGFEIVARARQVMLRPESHKNERGRIPRPYIRGSSVKPQRMRREDQIITDEHVEYEKALLAQMEAEDAAKLPNGECSRTSALEQELDAKYGPVSDADLEFEFETVPVPEAEQKEPGNLQRSEKTLVDYHLSVVAPCLHHGQCPLQLGDPKFYQISNHKHRLQWCLFNQVVHRPKYTMELKKGKRLATTWDKGLQDGFGTDKIPRGVLKGMQGTGRTGGNNTESGNLSYLIVHRLRNDPDSVQAIEEARAHNSDSTLSLPRILEFPSKVKKNVRLKVCAPSGHVEFWQVPKSLGKQTYHDARKAKQGDLWALGKKSAVVKSRLSAGKVEELGKLANMQRKFVVKEKRKRDWKKLVSRQVQDFDDPLDVLDDLVDDVERSKKYRTQGKRARYDVDERDLNGK